MLFLAVFCGFLAENQREHMVEHNREKQYMQSIYTNLKKDTSSINNFIDQMFRNFQQLDSIQNMINSGQYLTDPNKFYSLSLSSRRVTYFEPNNSAFEQIKNSGNLRLIRKKGIADSIINYYSIIQEKINNQESRYFQSTADIAAALWDMLDSKYYTRDTIIDRKIIIRRSIEENVSLEKIDKQKLLKFKNLCYEKMLIARPFWGFVVDLNTKATNLLSLIKNEYHLE